MSHSLGPAVLLFWAEECTALLASLGWCLRWTLDLGRAGLASWASTCGSSCMLSDAVCLWAQQVRKGHLTPVHWNWAMAACWTRPWAADWAQASRTPGEREEPISTAAIGSPLQPKPAPCRKGTSRQSLSAPSLSWRNLVQMGLESNRISHKHPV